MSAVTEGGRLKKGLERENCPSRFFCVRFDEKPTQIIFFICCSIRLSLDIHFTVAHFEDLLRLVKHMWLQHIKNFERQPVLFRRNQGEKKTIHSDCYIDTNVSF